eukprot:gene9271-1549_t
MENENSEQNGNESHQAEGQGVPKRLMSHRNNEKKEHPSKVAKTASNKVRLEEVSYPPSRDELLRFEDVPLSQLPEIYKRADNQRVFCNRNVDMNDICYIGFDMDYTLAVYKDPAIYELTYGLILEQLVEAGYPETIRKFIFDPQFPIRGLVLDSEYGNLLKLDAFGHIILVYHGHRSLSKDEIEESEAFKENENGTALQGQHTLLTYRSIHHDVRGAMDSIHMKGILQSRIMENLEKYVHKDSRLPILLQSDFNYTKVIMSFLFDVKLPKEHNKRDWVEYFDLIVVSARKPLFFLDGTVLREVDQSTGRLKLGQYSGGSHRGRVFSGGSADIICDMLGKRGDSILYVGDHIFGDVLKSKKLRGWKEIDALHGSARHYQRLKNLEFMLAELFRGLDSDAKEEPDSSELKRAIEEASIVVDKDFNGFFGSLFRSGSRQSFFAMQTARYADLYSSSLVNLANYPLFYNFRSVTRSLPHESAVWRR